MGGRMGGLASSNGSTCPSLGSGNNGPVYYCISRCTILACIAQKLPTETARFCIFCRILTAFQKICVLAMLYGAKQNVTDHCTTVYRGSI